MRLRSQDPSISQSVDEPAARIFLPPEKPAIRQNRNPERKAQLPGALAMVLALLIAPNAHAADFRCISKAIAKTYQAANESVRFTMVTLHANGIAGYAIGSMVRCNARCLRTPGWFNMLLNNKKVNTQPFDVHRPLRIALDGLYAARTPMRLHSATAEYRLYPSCVEDLLIGDDQWGNHWTISFQ